MTITPLSGRSRSPHAGRLSVSARPRGRRVRIAVRGEVDATNAKDLAVAVCAAVGPGHRMVELDLQALGFLAVDGIAALHAINARLARHGVTWTVLPSRPVSRLLALCDPEGLIPRANAAPQQAQAEPA